MTLCVCAHPREQHHQYDAGWYCQLDCLCDWYRKTADSEESTASLPAGDTPEGLAEATVAESVNVTPPTDEARVPEQTVEPRTEAGRAVLETYGRPKPEQDGINREDLRHFITAIEREAAAVAAPAPLLHDNEEDRALLERIARSFANWAPGHSGEWAGHLIAAIKSERTRPERMRAIYARLSQPSPDDSGGDDAWWESDDPDWQEDNYG